MLMKKTTKKSGSKTTTKKKAGTKRPSMKSAPEVIAQQVGAGRPPENGVQSGDFASSTAPVRCSDAGLSKRRGMQNEIRPRQLRCCGGVARETQPARRLTAGVVDFVGKGSPPGGLPTRGFLSIFGAKSCRSCRLLRGDKTRNSRPCSWLGVSGRDRGDTAQYGLLSVFRVHPIRVDFASYDRSTRADLGQQRIQAVGA